MRLRYNVQRQYLLLNLDGADGHNTRAMLSRMPLWIAQTVSSLRREWGVHTDWSEALELSSDLPLYETIKRDLQGRILRGELPEGTRILPEIELAKQAGVSRSTARKALQALELEGYLSRTAGRGTFVKQPAAAARPATGTRRGTLAITVAHLDRFNHSGQIVQGFMNTAVSNGFHAVIHPPLQTGMDEFEYLLSVRRSGIDGWALWLINDTDKNGNLLRNFCKSGHALMLVDRYSRRFESDYVVTDNQAMARQLTCELIRRGHRDIGMLTFPMDSTLAEDRLTGYRRALEENGIPIQEDLIVMDMILGVEPFRMQLLALLGRRKRPTAIFCDSAHHAACLARELELLAYKTPDDIELAIVDDNCFAEQYPFPVLSATERSYEMGRIAAESIQKRIENPDLPPQQIVLEFDLNFAPAS